MVVRDFDVVGILTLPSEADAKLIVDPNTALTQSVAAQSFQAIPRRNGELSDLAHAIELIELSARGRPERRRTSPSGGGRLNSIEDISGRSIPKRLYHALHYNDGHYILSKAARDERCKSTYPAAHYLIRGDRFAWRGAGTQNCPDGRGPPRASAAPARATCSGGRRASRCRGCHWVAESERAGPASAG